MTASGARTGGEPASASLEPLAAELRVHEVIAPHLRDDAAEPALGALVAQGPRAAEAPEDYVLLFEAIREGYLLHYGAPRLLDPGDPDLLLLAGDYLYALGLRRLAARGDLQAVRELGDLISLSAQIHASPADGAGRRALLDALWLASAVAVAWGGGEGHEEAKRAAREGRPEAEAQLIAAATERLGAAGSAPLARAAEAIGFASEHLPDRG